MEFHRIIQIVYVLFFFISTGILAAALVTVVSWPQIRGRGLLLAALAVRLLAAAGYVAMSLLQLVTMVEWLELSVEIIQGCYMLLIVTSLAGDGLFLFSLISLGLALRNIQGKGGLTAAVPFDPSGKF